ncbi:unnamed protein product [Chrysodeixis includens]|uniref:G-protein coupled receptors family 2 profile 2 domain-containing protein n=1 Tax=Chrysodeixis includens TaxID=689277 RepID=A0A9P0BPB6_CHRIL|nr:unnamed protein product [Chrysodeixis includens]
MLAFRISVFCLAMYVVQSAKTNAVETYEDIDTNLNNVKINRSQYCENKLCMYKCCGKNEIMFGKKCKVKSRAPRLQGRVKYSEIPVTKTINGTVVNSTKRLEKDFEFIHNYKFMYKYRKNESASWKINHIWENGSASIELVKNEVIHIVEPNMFCVDYLVYTNPKKKNEIQLFAVVINQEEDLTFTYFSAIGMLVSCFFLALVLFVYGLLPSLRNLIGKVLMAYILSLFVTYLVRAILPFAIHRMHSSDCKTFSPVMYFAALSSFFWLKIMSFDLFWVIRGTRKCRAINRQGENMKFMWYCLYAWGVPLLITTFVVVLDNIDISKYGLMSPKFEKCFGYSLYFLNILVYVHTPETCQHLLK